MNCYTNGLKSLSPDGIFCRNAIHEGQLKVDCVSPGQVGCYETQYPGVIKKDHFHQEYNFLNG